MCQDLAAERSNKAELFRQYELKGGGIYENAFLFADAVGISWLRRGTPCHHHDNN